MEESEAFSTAMWTAHFGNIFAALVLFGASLFPFYAQTHSWPRRWARFAPLVLASILLASGLLAAALTIADLTGDPTSLMALTDLRGFFIETSFGPFWLTRLVLSAALFAIALGFATPRVLPDSHYRTRDMILLIFSAGVIVSLAAVGHARSADDTGITVGSEAIHLLAAGAWIGGLPPLLFCLSTAAQQRREKTLALPLLYWFSYMGQWAVTVILVGGISTLAALLAEWNIKLSGLHLSDYGLALLVKLALLGIMLVIAGINRFILMPRLEKGAASLGLFWKMVLAECVLGTLIIAAATTLSRLPPPV